MKTALLILHFSISLFSTSISQSIGGVALEDINAEYIQITLEGSWFKPKIVAYIDCGQSFHQKDMLLKDEQEEALQFNSVMDALNFMHKYNYELLQVYTKSTDSSSTAYYVMKKIKPLKIDLIESD